MYHGLYHIFRSILEGKIALIYHYLREHHKINTYYPNICQLNNI